VSRRTTIKRLCPQPKRRLYGVLNVSSFDRVRGAWSGHFRKWGFFSRIYIQHLAGFILDWLFSSFLFPDLRDLRELRGDFPHHFVVKDPPLEARYCGNLSASASERCSVSECSGMAKD
jgi:hypothetical protein